MEDLPFWQAVCAHNSESILELGCGTGRLLLPLAAQVMHAYGIDRDRDMLAVLVEQLPVSNKQIRLIQADIRSFAFGIHFPTIILPCNTFSTLPQNGQKEILRTVCRHLSPDGIFAVSMPNPTLLISLPQTSSLEYEETLDHPIDGQPVIVSSGWQRASNHLTFEWVYEHQLLYGDPVRYQMYSKHYLYPTQGYIEAFESCGLEILDIFGDFNHSNLNEDSPFLILVAGKN
jgi:SAM-dependent methyltransferase